MAGDFYDVFPLGDGKLGLVVADVSGKGVGASLVMASVKAVVPLLAAGRSAGTTLTELNRRLSKELLPREFVALCFAQYDTASGALEIANAGLPDPYLLSARKIEALSVPGPRLPLGARNEMVYDSLRVAVEAQECVLFVTDGLPEAPTAAGEPLGYEQFGRLVAGAHAASANFLERLLESVRAETVEPREDDWTALLLERRS